MVYPAQAAARRMVMLLRDLGPSRRSGTAILARMATRLDVSDDFHLLGASAPEWAQRLLARPAGEPDMCSAAGVAGFEHLGRFSARYRALFGELPSQTFRKASS